LHAAAHPVHNPDISIRPLPAGAPSIRHMWGRRKRDRTAAVDVEPASSYWSTHPDPAAPHAPTAPLPENTVVSSMSVTVDGKPVDLSSPDGHHLVGVLANSGLLTEHHVYQTTQHANPEQQKQIMDLLLQRQAGTISDPDFAVKLIEVMRAG